VNWKIRSFKSLISRKCKCRSPNELHLCIADANGFPLVCCATVSVQPLLRSSLLQCFPMGPIPLKMPLPVGYLDRIKYMVPWAHPSQHLKWHLDQFCRFLHSSR